MNVEYAHVFLFEILECFYLIIIYYVEYYLTPTGCLVDHLPICMNG